jgi:hypothetical protein
MATVDIQREHFRTPLHAFNVRRKVVNMVPVTAEQFEERVKAGLVVEQEAKVVVWRKGRFLFSSIVSLVARWRLCERWHHDGLG